jgi:hypothetical protein
MTFSCWTIVHPLIFFCCHRDFTGWSQMGFISIITEAADFDQAKRIEYKMRLSALTTAEWTHYYVDTFSH